MDILAFLILLPLVGALAVGGVPALLGAPSRETSRNVALAFSLATFAASLVVLARFQTGNGDFQLVEHYVWIESLGASFDFAVDGISLLLVLLTTFLMPLIILASWNQKERYVGYFAAFLLLEAAVIGVFLATDLLLFYVFFEFSLVPMYLIIGIWGGKNRRYAATKFFIYTLLGGLLMLGALLYLYVQTGAVTADGSLSFSYFAISQVEISSTAQTVCFLAFLLAFAVKVPVFPVHTWLPDAHTEAPTAGSVILAAVLLKMGTFGMLRYSLPLFPQATQDAVPWVLTLSVIGILYGAVVALIQKDVKKLVAYSSVSHMGFIVLGIFALNLTSASASVIQMVNHGLSTGALFLLIGFLYERRHTRMIAAFGGLQKQTPILAGFFLIVSMSSLALPGLNGFVGEFPILLGTFQNHRLAAVLASFGAVLAALYLLWAYQRIFHGPLEGAENQNTSDLKPIEIGVIVPLLVLIIGIGIYPKPLFDRIEPSVERVLVEMETGVVAGDDVAAAGVTVGFDAGGVR